MTKLHALVRVVLERHKTFQRQALGAYMLASWKGGQANPSHAKYSDHLRTMADQRELIAAVDKTLETNRLNEATRAIIRAHLDGCTTFAKGASTAEKAKLRIKDKIFRHTLEAGRPKPPREKS